MGQTSYLLLVIATVLLMSLPSRARAQSGLWTTQVASLASQSEAEEHVARLRERGLDAYWVKSTVLGGGTRYRVRVGRFGDQTEARAIGERLRSQGVVRDFFVADYKTVSEPATGKEAAPDEMMTRGGRANESVGAVPPDFVTFQDEAVGYSLDHPSSWRGGAWSGAKRRSQGADGGASFKSKKDRAFCNVIWNKLLDASDPQKLDNAALVDAILKSMSSGADAMHLSELSRRVESGDEQIKISLDLSAGFHGAADSDTPDFLGKAVIVRCQRGILLVVVFYAQDAPPTAAANAEKIIHSVRAPE